MNWNQPALARTGKSVVDGGGEFGQPGARRGLELGADLLLLRVQLAQLHAAQVLNH